MESMKKRLRKEKGITLIALIVTIIVLLILAGISIGAITGDNGIIKQAQSAKRETERSEIEEQINTIVIDNSQDRVMDKDKLIDDFENKLPDGKEIVDSDDLIYIIYPEYSFQVDIDLGEVAQVDVEQVEDSTPWELAGSGTEADPYLIESIEDLVAFSNSVNNGTNYNGKYIKLTTDLDFNLPFSYDNPKTKVSETTNRIIEEDSNGTELKTFLTSGTGFNPIGNSNKSFYGTFDGNGKVIKNIYINRPDENYVALFGNATRTIEKLGVTGKIVGKKQVGGILGQALSSADINFCYTNVDIQGEQEVGGIAGVFANVSNCYNVGNVTVSRERGGSSADRGGGIGAFIENVSNSYNLGTVKLEISSGFIAGIVATGVSGTKITNSVNLGDVVVGDGIKAGFLGGILARRGRAENSYNFGKLDINKTNRNGGILAEEPNEDDIIKNCFYLNGTATGGINGKDVEGQAMPLEESEMPSVISVVMTDSEKVEWNGEMVDIWKEDTNNINNGYPILFWQ